MSEQSETYMYLNAISDSSDSLMGMRAESKTAVRYRLSKAMNQKPASKHSKYIKIGGGSAAMGQESGNAVTIHGVATDLAKSRKRKKSVPFIFIEADAMGSRFSRKTSFKTKANPRSNNAQPADKDGDDGEEEEIIDVVSGPSAELVIKFLLAASEDEEIISLSLADDKESWVFDGLREYVGNALTFAIAGAALTSAAYESHLCHR